MIRSLLRTAFGLRGAKETARFKVLFVCMGNLCRSPTAEAVFRRYLENADLWPQVQCASAGTHDFHVGSLPDGRARTAASKRGYDLSKLRGRHVADEDFDRYDLILVMDRQNKEAIDQRCPVEHREKVRMLMEFARNHAVADVPDPYYGSAKGFERVLDMIEDACGALLEYVREQHLIEKDNASPKA